MVGRCRRAVNAAGINPGSGLAQLTARFPVSGADESDRIARAPVASMAAEMAREPDLLVRFGNGIRSSNFLDRSFRWCMKARHGSRCPYERRGQQG